MNENKKYYVMGGSIIAVIFVLLISMMLLSSCTKKNSYTNIEKKLISAAEKCIINEDVIVNEGESLYVTSDQLVEAGYIKSLDKLKNDGCTATVKIMNNAGIYSYLPNLTCTNYQTTTIKQKVIDDNITNSKDGLYAVDGEYVFKGKNPNNRITFGGTNWYIIRIDASGNLKLISAAPALETVQWDDKFNEDTDTSIGENDYETSSIHEHLLEKYKNYEDKVKKHLVPFDACIGSRDNLNLTTSITLDCAKTLSNQYIGLINISDYALASYDKDCTNLLSGSCMNYNYFRNFVDETWTLNTLSDTTYDSLVLIGYRISSVASREPHKYHDVVYISGDELYLEGDGSIDNPYTIK